MLQGKVTIVWVVIVALIYGCSDQGATSPNAGQYPVFSDSGIDGVGKSRARDVQYIGPKTGAFESDFMISQSAMYADFSKVERAYLIQAKYSDDGETFVVLVITPMNAESDELVERIKDDLYEVAGGKPPLDILFVNEDNESELTDIAEPFYSRK